MRPIAITPGGLYRMTEKVPAYVVTAKALFSGTLVGTTEIGTVVLALRPSANWPRTPYWEVLWEDRVVLIDAWFLRTKVSP